MHLRPLNCSLYFLFAQLDLSHCPGKSFLCMFNGFFFLSVTAQFLNCFLRICFTSWEFEWVTVTLDSALHRNIIAKCKAHVRLVKRKKSQEENIMHHLMQCHITPSYLSSVVSCSSCNFKDMQIHSKLLIIVNYASFTCLCSCCLRSLQDLTVELRWHSLS